MPQSKCTTSFTKLTLPELPERGFITRETRRKCRWGLASLLLVTIPLLIGPLLTVDATSDAEPKPYQVQRGSLIVSRPTPASEKTREPVTPTQPVAVKLPSPQSKARDDVSTKKELIANESVPTPQNVATASLPEQSQPVSQAVEQLLTELAETWEGIGNGQTEAEGQIAPAYVFASMSSYQRALKEHRAVIIAFNTKTELRFQLGSSLTSKSWKESPLNSWLDLPGYSKRVSLLPPSDPVVSALRARFLNEHPNWETRHTQLMLAVPAALDDAILQTQLAACQRSHIRPGSRVVTIGDLVPQSNGVAYVVRDVKDLSSRDRVAVR